MRYVAIVLFIILGGGILLFAVPQKVDTAPNSQYLRIHIRANSNDQCDQDVKYKVKQAVVDYLTPYLANATSKEQAVDIVSTNARDIESVCDVVLRANGFDYGSNACIRSEFFPVRSYLDFTLDEGYYDALIVNLGTGSGDNWWCVVYPPLCFVNETSAKNFTYKSKLYEIIKNFFD